MIQSPIRKGKLKQQKKTSFFSPIALEFQMTQSWAFNQV